MPAGQAIKGPRPFLTLLTGTTWVFQMRPMRMVLIFLLLFPAGVAFGEPPDRKCSAGTFGSVFCIRDAFFVYDLCNQLKSSSERHGLDTGFFTRLIWQESRFDPNAKSHANAMGIAQFIRSTAKLRGLSDPYNPAEALEKSAEYLADMERRFGNLGFAAIGYNGGETRATNFKAGTNGLARETVDYVKIITGVSAEAWRDAPPETLDLALEPGKPFLPACYEMAAKRRISKPPSFEPEYGLKPWGVELAFGATGKQARASYTQKTGSCRALLRRERLDLIPVKTRRGSYVMARIGRNTQGNARKLCLQLSRTGCRCTVKRNR